MAIELRTIRCHHFRVSREPCPNPAVVEILRPAPHLLCAQHAAMELGAGEGFSYSEGWEAHGAEEYARYCEQAVDALQEMDAYNDRGPYADNPVLQEVVEEAITYLEEYELERARTVLERLGGERRETTRERGKRELWEKWSGKLRD